MERLTKRNGKYVEYSNENYNESVDNYTMLDKCLHKLADYEDAEEQGLLLRLPCKVGDRVWIIRQYHDTKVAKEGTVNGMYFDKWMNLKVKVANLGVSTFGIRVFLTKEEAEKKIEEMKGE